MVVYAAAAMVIVDPRRRPIVASVAIGLTLFACSGWFLSLRPAFAPMTPGATETAMALAITLVAAIAGGLLARAPIDPARP